jgi:signal transduction histidine kinase/HAMP domain-containing protein
MADAQSGVNPSATPGAGRRGRIVRRYFLIFAALVGGSLVISVLLEMGFRFQETRQSLEVVQRQMAELAALRIRNYVEDVAQAVRVAAQPRSLLQGRLTDDYIVELRNLLKNVPAIRDVVALGPNGHEEFRLSRIGRSLPDARADHASAPYFTAAHAGQTYFGPVIFPPDSFEPRIIIAVPIEPFRGEVIGVLTAEVNVRYVWDVVQEIRVGESGYAYVVSGTGTLVAHPDLHLVLQRKDLSDHPQVAALRDPGRGAGGTGVYKNLSGQRVLVSHEHIPSVGWTVLVERPLTEAYGSLLASLARTGGILLIVCATAVGAGVLLGRRVVGPIEVLRRGAARLEAGELEARLELKTGDEFEELAEDFNRMAGRLHDAYTGLEQKVVERTQALKQSLDEVQGLGDIIRAVSASLDLEKVLQTIVIHATELSRSDAGLIYEFDAAAQVFRFRAGHLIRPEFIAMLEDVPPSFRDSIMGRAALKGVPDQIPDMEADASYAFKDKVLGEGYRSLLAIPTMQGSRLIGGIVVARRAVGGFTDKEIDLLHTFANGSTIAIENARLFLEVERKNTALQLASQHKSEFLANMSHELRTPMNAILGYTDLLLDGLYGNLDERVRKPVAQIHRNGQNLLRLINDVLDLSKIEAGRMDLVLGEYSVAEILESVMATTRPLAEGKGLALHASIEGKIDPCYGDGKRIFQVLLNLVGNAVKFTREGRVDVGAAASNGHVHYTIKDTGIGIPPEQLDSIFDEFGQGDPTVTREFGGTGLGLAIAKRFVTMHGGRIWAESTPEVGSTLHVVVPRQLTEVVEPQA